MPSLRIILLVVGMLAQGASAAPDFSAVVNLQPEQNAAGKVSGLIHNIGSWTIRNVVLRVRHHWRWGSGRGYDHEDDAVVTRLVYPGEAAGFAAVHLPPEHVPSNATYSFEITILELTEIRIVDQP